MTRFATLCLALSLAGAGCALDTSTDEPDEATAVQLQTAFPTTPGTYDRYLWVGTEQYAYKVYLPSGYVYNRPAAYPVVVLFHGKNGSANSFYASDGMIAMRALADVQGKILIYANSTPGNTPTGNTPWDSTNPAVQHTAYGLALVATAISGFHTDANRVYLAGHSIGAHFALYLATLLPNDVRAVGVAAGFWGAGPRPAPVAPAGYYMPTFMVHGTADAVVPFSWGSAAFTSLYGANGCTRPTILPTLPAPAVAYQWTHCRVGETRRMVELVHLTGHSHAWPTWALHGYDASAGMLAYFDAS